MGCARVRKKGDFLRSLRKRDQRDFQRASLLVEELEHVSESERASDVRSFIHSDRPSAALVDGEECIVERFALRSCIAHLVDLRPEHAPFDMRIRRPMADDLVALSPEFRDQRVFWLAREDCAVAAKRENGAHDRGLASVRRSEDGDMLSLTPVELFHKLRP